MRHLAQPRVLKLASIASLVTALACYPRLSLWLNRSAPIWYLEAVIFFCGIILWGFVFAWHTQYTHRPVFILKLEYAPFITVTLAGIAVATAFHLFLDPVLRLKMPADFPADLKQWLAMALFSVAFNQLFFIIAPFDCLAHASVSKPPDGHRADRSVWSLRADDQIPVRHHPNSILVVCGAPGRQNRHGISIGLVLSARRGALELVVDASCRSEKFVGCGGQSVNRREPASKFRVQPHGFD
jgi:hypothetical protein